MQTTHSISCGGADLLSAEAGLSGDGSQGETA